MSASELAAISLLPFVNSVEEEAGIKEGERVITVVTTQGLSSAYKEARVRIQLRVLPDSKECPHVRFASIIYHLRKDDDGVPEEQFMDDLHWGEPGGASTLADVVTAAFQLLEQGEKSLIPLDEDDALHIWEGHPRICVCSNFPIPYSETMNPEDKAKEVGNIMKRLNAFNIERQKHLQLISRSRVLAAREYKPHAILPSLFRENDCWLPEWFAPGVLDAVCSGNADAIRALFAEEFPGVWSFRMFTPAFCDQMCAELAKYESMGLPLNRPNSMNNHGCVLNDIGMECAFDELLSRVLRPLAAVMFPEAGGRTLDSHHTFVVSYSTTADLNLDMHEDSADVTFNVNLCDAFTGSGLRFCGLRDQARHRQNPVTYEHVKGKCVVHRGDQRHGADTINTGKRDNLIVWCSSSLRSRNEDPAATPRHTRTNYESGEQPALTCLSRTHDQDYDMWHHHASASTTV